MNKITSSVDMSGDISRNNQPLSRPRHDTIVGEPINSRPYSPNRHNQHANEGFTTRLVDRAIVLHTICPDDTEEYRIGKFENENQIVKEGLRSKDNASKLNQTVAKSCFGDSPVFLSRSAALEQVDHIYPNNSGIVVLHMHCKFPY